MFFYGSAGKRKCIVISPQKYYWILRTRLSAPSNGINGTDDELLFDVDFPYVPALLDLCVVVH